MKDINKVILIGRLGANPELRETKTGKSLAFFLLATSQRKKTKIENSDPMLTEESWVDDTQWHKVVCWGRLGKICMDIFKKGNLVYVEGSLKTSRVEIPGGEVKYYNEIVAANINILEKKQSVTQNEQYLPQ